MLPIPLFIHETILKTRYDKNKKIEVLIRWKGMDEYFDTWEPLDSVPCDLCSAQSQLLSTFLVSEQVKNGLASDCFDQELYAIEKILFAVTDKMGNIFVYIKWDHYSMADATWEPVNHIKGFWKKGLNLEEHFRRAQLYLSFNKETQNGTRPTLHNATSVASQLSNTFSEDLHHKPYLGSCRRLTPSPCSTSSDNIGASTGETPSLPTIVQQPTLKSSETLSYDKSKNNPITIDMEGFTGQGATKPRIISMSTEQYPLMKASCQEKCSLSRSHEALRYLVGPALSLDDPDFPLICSRLLKNYQSLRLQSYRDTLYQDVRVKQHLDTLNLLCDYMTSSSAQKDDLLSFKVAFQEESNNTLLNSDGYSSDQNKKPYTWQNALVNDLEKEERIDKFLEMVSLKHHHDASSSHFFNHDPERSLAVQHFFSALQDQLCEETERQNQRKKELLRCFSHLATENNYSLDPSCQLLELSTKPSFLDGVGKNRELEWLLKNKGHSLDSLNKKTFPQQPFAKTSFSLSLHKDGTLPLCHGDTARTQEVWKYQNSSASLQSSVPNQTAFYYSPKQCRQNSEFSSVGCNSPRSMERASTVTENLLHDRSAYPYPGKSGEGYNEDLTSCFSSFPKTFSSVNDLLKGHSTYGSELYLESLPKKDASDITAAYVTEHHRESHLKQYPDPKSPLPCQASRANMFFPEKKSRNMLLNNTTGRLNSENLNISPQHATSTNPQTSSTELETTHRKASFAISTSKRCISKHHALIPDQPQQYNASLNESNAFLFNSDGFNNNSSPDITRNTGRPTQTCAGQSIKRPMWTKRVSSPQKNFEEIRLSSSGSLPQNKIHHAIRTINSNENVFFAVGSRGGSRPKSSKPRIFYHYNVAIPESESWVQFCRSSRKSISRLLDHSSSKLSDSGIRCYCAYVERLPEKEEKIILEWFLQHQPGLLKTGVQCSICSSYEHIQCCLAWKSLKDTDENNDMGHLIRHYVCIPCRFQLLDPFFPVDAICALSCIQLAFPQQDSGNSKRFQLSLNLSPAVISKLQDGTLQLQLRGCELSPSTYRISGYPHQLTLSSSRTPLPPSLVIKPPGTLKKRKDAPHTLSVKNLHLTKRMCFEGECTYLNSTTYLFAIVSGSAIHSKSILHTIKKNNWLSLQLCRELSHALVCQRNETLHKCDDIVVEQQDVNLVSLQCPCTLMRIQLPGRGLFCRHLQCFDVSFFIQSQSRMCSHKNRWKCPVCYQFCFPHEIILDEFFQTILDETSESDRAVTFGSSDKMITWKVAVHENQSNLDQTMIEMDDSLDLGLNVENSSLNVVSPSKCRVNNFFQIEHSIEVIDLD